MLKETEHKKFSHKQSTKRKMTEPDHPPEDQIRSSLTGEELKKRKSNTDILEHEGADFSPFLG